MGAIVAGIMEGGWRGDGVGGGGGAGGGRDVIE